MRWANWQGCPRCTNGPAPGTRALLAWALENYPGSQSMGIYNCRSVRGSGGMSIHACGRALDLDPDGSRGRDGFVVGRSLVARLGEHGERLGIQAVIYNRTIWSRTSPQGRYYGGVHPHNDHLHIEMTPEAARSLTLATFRSVLGGKAKTESPIVDLLIGEAMTVKVGDTGEIVEYVQRRYNFWKYWYNEAANAQGRGGTSRPDLATDGVYGNSTKNAINFAESQFQVYTRDANGDFVDGVKLLALIDDTHILRQQVHSYRPH